MMKTYCGHEYEYQRMRRQGIASWDLRNKEEAISPDDRRFMSDVLAQEWAPRKGFVLELGCGTGPWLRWLAEQGFTGLGIDISPTAIEMAREQSGGLALNFQVGDVCQENFPEGPAIDLCLDGHFMHCLCDPEDRRHVLQKVADAMSDDGVFILLSMCAPIDTAAFERLYAGQLIQDHIIYCPTDSPVSFEDARTIGGKQYLPTRRIPHWPDLLTELEQENFHPLLVQFSHATPGEPVSALKVAAKKRG